MKFHQFAELFPMMSADELRSLAADMKENGQQQPITTLSGEILDGRNRFRACELLDLTPHFVAYHGNNPLGFVISHNLHRRHLSESQRGMIAAKLANLIKGQHPHPSIDGGGITREQAGKMLRVGEGTIQRAVKVQKSGVPELIAAVESGEATVWTAQSIADLPAEEQRLAVSKGAKNLKDRASVEAKKKKQLMAPTKPRLPQYIPSDSREIWLQAKLVLDRILPNDTQRESVLRDIITYCKNRIATQK